MTRELGVDGKTCFDVEGGFGSECHHRVEECPGQCVVDEGLTSEIYREHPALRASARELIAQGAVPYSGGQFAGYLRRLDNDTQQVEIYEPSLQNDGHLLRSRIPAQLFNDSRRQN